MLLPSLALCTLCSPCTWPGGIVPGAGDSVTIPSDRIVMLDISTPPLSRLTIKGTLYYDWTQPLLNLQTRTLYVDGGNLTIASANGMPYLSTSRAHITLLGLPPDDGRNNIADMEQTVFDKAFAVRQGTVTLNGATQYPAFTTLNATVDAGATSILVNGAVTYMVGW